MIMLKNCALYVSYGMALRTVCTFITFYLVKTYAPHWDMNLALPIILTILDQTDNLIFQIVQISKDGWMIRDTNCTKKSKVARIYQTSDKIIDILSYILCYIYFYKDLKDTLLEFFIIYRLIGVICYVNTYNKYFLVGFFDFVKEYMLYKYFFKKNQTYLPFLLICKLIFEYIFHLRMN